MNNNDIFNTLRIPSPVLRDYNLADRAYEIICEQIEEFSKNLDSNEEVVVMLTNFGQAITMSITDIGYQNPNFLYFYGYIDDTKSQLIQHISQLNFLLTSVKVSDRKPYKIGFIDDNTP